MVEDLLKAGELPCLVATSSLELGIDMGAIDLVLQVESPKSVTAGLQRIGRAGHNVGDVSKGRIFPKFRADLLECAVVAQRMREGQIETHGRAAQPARRARPADRRHGRLGRRRRPERRRPVRARHPHVLLRRARPRAARERARHARRPLPVRGVRRAARPHRLGPRGRHDPPAQGRPRRWPSPTPARSPTAACTRSTCPTAAASASSTRRWSTRRGPGQTFLLGASSWRIEEITRDRVIVTPAPGVPAAVPFWKGDGLGRPKELGQAIGAFARWAVDQEPADAHGRVPPRRAGGRQPRRLPARAAGRHARDPERPHDRDRALPRRDRRLAAVHPLPLRRPRARHLGPRAERPHPRAVRPRVGRHLVRRRDHRPPARRRRAARAPSW